MADTATAPEAPAAAPVAPDLAAAPAAQPGADQGKQPAQPQRTTRATSEVRAAENAAQRARDLGKQLQDAKAEAGRQRDGQGKFVSKAGAEAAAAGEDTTKPGAAEAPPPEGAGAKAPSPDDVPSLPAAKEPPAELRVDVPEDHPIRARRAAFTASSPEEARDLKGLLQQTGARVKQVEAADQRAVAAEKRADELYEKLVRTDAETAAEHKFKDTPVYQQAVEKYQNLLEREREGHLDEGTAKEFWDLKVGAEFKKFRDAELASRMTEVEEARHERDGETWLREAHAKIGEYPDDVRALPGFGAWVDRAVDEFEALVARKLVDVPDGDGDALHKAFAEHFRDKLQRQPAFRQLVKGWREEEAAKTRTAAEQEAARNRGDAGREAVKTFKEGAAETRRVTPPNPVAAISHGASAAGVTQPIENTPIKSNNQFDLQRGAADRAAQRAARYMGRK